MEWKKKEARAFWNELSPCDHLLQIYDNDCDLLNLLEGFATEGFNRGESVIVIATADHFLELEERLWEKGFNLFELKNADRYIALKADDVLESFMRNDIPDKILFYHVMKQLFGKARANSNQVRAFGEMVALLWQNGQHEATIQLKELWCQFCDENVFSLFCAYPSACFNNTSDDLKHVCNKHSKLIARHEKNKDQILITAL